MAFSHQITRTYKDISGIPKTELEVVTADGEKNFDGSIAGSSTDVTVSWACTRANLKSLMFFATGDLTIETNDGTTAQDTINIKANSPLIWSLNNAGISACPFSDDITGLYVTNAGGSSVTLSIRALEDVTP